MAWFLSLEWQFVACFDLSRLRFRSSISVFHSELEEGMIEVYFPLQLALSCGILQGSCSVSSSMVVLVLLPPPSIHQASKQELWSIFPSPPHSEAFHLSFCFSFLSFLFFLFFFIPSLPISRNFTNSTETSDVSAIALHTHSKAMAPALAPRQ